MTPLLQKPFRWGADLVLHSTTKFLNGHSDVVGGALVAAPGRQELAGFAPAPARSRQRSRAARALEGRGGVVVHSSRSVAVRRPRMSAARPFGRAGGAGGSVPRGARHGACA